MYHNIKVDVIYYNTPADYEMEFNLAGCCRMRLLNDKTTTIKAFLRSLSRAVDRSRIILAVGPLFNENGLLSVISHAIGRPMVPVDCAMYGLQSETPISLIEGATPLVDDNGILAGCIIESGPQVMILLTENKTVRKSVMISLIHPYVAQLANEESENAADEGAGPTDTEIVAPPVPVEDPVAEAVPLPDEIPVPTDPIPDEEPAQEVAPEEEEQPTEETEPEEDAQPEEEIPTEDSSQPAEEVASQEEDLILDLPDPDEDLPVSGDHLKPEEEYILDPDDNAPADYDDTEEDPDFFMESEPKVRKKRNAAIQNNIDFITADIHSDFQYDEPEEDFAPKAKFRLPILILFIALLVVLALLVFLVIFLPLRSGNSPIAYFKDIFTQLSGET